MSSSLAKSGGTSLIGIQSVASAGFVIGAPVDVSAKFAAFVMIHFGRRAATALTVGARIRVEGSTATSGDDAWGVLAEFQSILTACEAEAATGTNNAGQAVVTCASTANIAAQAMVFFDNTTIGNSEWRRVKSIVANTSVTFEDNLTHAQSAGASTMYTLAEYYTALLDLTGIMRVRVVVDNSGTGQAIAVEASMSTADSIG